MTPASNVESILRGQAVVYLDDQPGFTRRVSEVTCFEEPDEQVGIFNYLLLVVLDDGLQVCLCDDGTVRFVTDNDDIDTLEVGTWNHTLLDPWKGDDDA